MRIQSTVYYNFYFLCYFCIFWWNYLLFFIFVNLVSFPWFVLLLLLREKLSKPTKFIINLLSDAQYKVGRLLIFRFFSDCNLGGKSLKMYHRRSLLDKHPWKIFLAKNNSTNNHDTCLEHYNRLILNNSLILMQPGFKWTNKYTFFWCEILMHWYYVGLLLTKCFPQLQICMIFMSDQLQESSL